MVFVFNIDVQKYLSRMLRHKPVIICVDECLYCLKDLEFQCLINYSLPRSYDRSLKEIQQIFEQRHPTSHLLAMNHLDIQFSSLVSIENICLQIAHHLYNWNGCIDSLCKYISQFDSKTTHNVLHNYTCNSLHAKAANYIS